MTQDLGTRPTTNHNVGTVLFELRSHAVVALSIFLAGLLLSCGGGAGPSGGPVPIRMEVEAGFDGKVRLGRWIPVTVEFENLGPDFVGEVQVRGGGRSSSQYVADVVLPKDGRKQITLHVPHTAGVDRVGVEVVRDDEVVASLESRVSVDDEGDIFVGVAGRRTGAWNLLTTLDFPGNTDGVAVAPIPPDSFPRQPEALDALDVVALGEVPVQTLYPEGLEALEGWVANGGALVLSGGPDAKINLKGLPVQLMPVVLGDALELESASALEELGNGTFPAGFPLTVISTDLVVSIVMPETGPCRGE